MYNSIGFIGCGNMGSAIARAVCKNGYAGRVCLSNRTPEKAEALASELGCGVSDNHSIAKGCDLIFLDWQINVLQGMNFVCCFRTIYIIDMF